MKATKAIVTFVICTMSAISLFGDVDASNVTRRKDPEGFRRKVLERTGGRVRKENSGQGKFVYINSQSLVEEPLLKIPAKQLGASFRLDISVEKGAVATLADVPNAIASSGAAAGIVLLENDDMPTMLVAPEARYAIVNVKALAKDNPPSNILMTRVQREMYRAFGYLCGAADAITEGCVMRPVSTLKDIDALQSPMLSAEFNDRIYKHMLTWGIQPYVVATYRKACEDGWAPAPKDDVQQKIWDEIHAIPANPMKIEFDPKKGR